MTSKGHIKHYLGACETIMVASTACYTNLVKLSAQLYHMSSGSLDTCCYAHMVTPTPTRCYDAIVVGSNHKTGS